MQINSNDDNIKKLINTSSRQMYELENSDIKPVFEGYISDNDTNIEKNVTQIMGGHFDGKIGHTMQSYETGDCWILSDVNALNTTDWGKEAIKNAIKPHESDGVVVTLDGAKGYIKDFHITRKDLAEARQNEKYSAGDDDMLAIELAVEKYAKLRIEQGKLDKDTDKVLDGGIGISAAELISKTKQHIFSHNKGISDNILNKIEDNKGVYAVRCSFKEDKPPFYEKHGYTFKSIDVDKSGNKIVTLINPWDSSKVIKVPYDKFKSNVNILAIYDDPKHPDKNLTSPHELMAKDIKEKQCRMILNTLYHGINKGDDELVQKAVNSINKDNILSFTENEYSENIIKNLDKYKSGWGQGKDKKALILPIINALIEKAEEEGIDKKAVENFKKICINQELDAAFYTNSDKITKEVQKMKSLILKHE